MWGKFEFPKKNYGIFEILVLKNIENHEQIYNFPNT